MTRWAAGMLMLGLASQGAEPPRDGLVLHLDASRIEGAKGGEKLSRWPDMSGREHHLSQSDAAHQPSLVLDALNRLAVVRFNGQSWLDGPAVLPEGDDTFTFAAVWLKTDTSTVAAIGEQADDGVGRRASLLTVHESYGFNGQNNDEHGLLRYPANRAVLSVMTLDATGTVRLWHNDGEGGKGVMGRIDAALQNVGTKLFRVGGKAMAGNERLRGDIAEFLVWERELAPDEIAAVNDSLGTKWGIGKVSTVSRDELDRGPDYTSKVPQYTFATTLAEQEAQLAGNPLLQRFRESRQALAADPWRPQYHFVSPESSLNDPNGLCFWQGRWHLFYQGYPPEDRRQHWGHAVSDDLIHWRDLPYAIYPSPEECCYSGATLVEDDRVIAMYHGTKVGNMVALSSDPLLLNWEKLTGQPVIPMRNADGSVPPYRVFDPCVWKDHEWYYALSGGTVPGPGGQGVRADFLFRSKDLATWEYLHDLTDDDRYSLVGDDGACPYFWPIGDKHILLHYSHMSGGRYLLGDWDPATAKFVITAGGEMNFGASNPGGMHAPSACPDGQGGVIGIWNMNPAKPTRGWDQIMSLPRRLTLGDDGDLRQTPAGDYASLRGAEVTVGETPLPANQEVVLDTVSGKSLEFIAELAHGGASSIELNVLRSPRREEYTKLVIYPNRGYNYRNRGGRPGQDTTVVLDNTRSSSLPDVMARPPEVAQVYVPQGEPLKLHVFIDHSSVEVFINDRQCVACRVYPGREDSVGVSLRAGGRDAVLKSLSAWPMGSIYGADGGGD